MGDWVTDKRHTPSPAEFLPVSGMFSLHVYLLFASGLYSPHPRYK